MSLVDLPRPWWARVLPDSDELPRMVEPAPIDDPAIAAARRGAELCREAYDRAVRLVVDYEAVHAVLDEIGVPR